MTTPTPPPAVPGVRLDEVIGQGATSSVWAGTRIDTGVDVAVKVTAPERLHVGQLMELAARETAILAKVEHPHIVRVHEAHPLTDGSVAVVLDLASGGALADLVAARGRLDPGEVATVCTPVAEALAAAHSSGVIHGDVSPGNILFTADGRPLLGDFEAARLVGESHPPQVAGTPGFVAPEVQAGDVPTEASDVFGIGALIWFALTGRSWAGPPGSGDGQGERAAPSLEEAVRLLGPGFGPAAKAMLAEDPLARPSAQQAALLAYQAATPIPVRLVPRRLAGTDPDLVLTHRLRQRADLPDPREQRTTHGPAVGRVTRRQRYRGRPRVPLARRRSVVVASLGISAAVLLGVVLRLTPVAAADAPSGSSSAAGQSVTVDVGADLHPVFVDLITARGQALIECSPSALTAVDDPGSKLLASDLAIIRDLQKTGHRYVGLSFTIAAVSEASMDGTTARIRAVVGRNAYQVIDADGRSQEVEADPGQSLLYVLLRSDGRWRLFDVTR